MSSLRLK